MWLIYTIRYNFKKEIDLYSDRKGFPGGSVVQNLPTNAEDAGNLGSIPESGRSPEEGHGNPLHYSCLGNPMDRGTWQAIVHRITESGTTEHAHTDVGNCP